MRVRPTILAIEAAVAVWLPLSPACGQQTRLEPLSSPRWAVASEGGAVVDYPANIFSIDAGASPRGSGRRLQTADGRGEFLVYVSSNADHESPRSYVRKYLAVPEAKLDYKRITDRFFVVSGIEQRRVFYSRCNYPRGSAGPMHCIYLLYPEAETKAWDAIVTRMSLSLRPRP
jgi:hypothetical protein